MPCEAPPNQRVLTCMGPTGAVGVMCPVCRGKANILARRGSIGNLAQLQGSTAAALQTGWTTRALTIVQDLYTEFFGVGGPPCPYAFALTGSGARKEACPYSDLDCFIVMDAGGGVAQRQAFNTVSRRVKERLEAIEFDSARHAGPNAQAIKGMLFCAGGLNPGGWYGGGQLPCAMTANAVDLAGVLEQNITNPNPALDHVISGLQESAFGFGTAALHADFLREADLIMGQTCWKFASRPALTHKKRGGLDTIRDVINNADFAIPAATATRINIKKNFYRMPQFIIKGLAWYYGVQTVVTLDQITALVTGGRMSMAKAQTFINLLDAPLKIRVLSHLHARDESDYVRVHGDATPNPNGEYVMTANETAQLRALIAGLTTVRALAVRFVGQKDKVIGKRKNPFAEP